MTNPQSNQKSYFDIHTSGIGYIQRVREVPVSGGRKAQPFLACTVAGLVGPARDPILRYFDVRVSGNEAKQLVQGYLGNDDPKQRPLVRFRLGDLWVDPFLRPSGERKGEAAAALKARLLKTELLNRSVLSEVAVHEIITRGIGYLNRPEEVVPKDGDPFLSCSIAALCGPTNDPEYRYFDTIVATASAQHLVRRCVQAVESKQKVLIAFQLNDMKADAYIRTKGDNAGKPAATMESKLVQIGFIKIDGKEVYRTEPKSEDAGQSVAALGTAEVPAMTDAPTTEQTPVPTGVPVQAGAAESAPPAESTSEPSVPVADTAPVDGEEAFATSDTPVPETVDSL